MSERSGSSPARRGAAAIPAGAALAPSLLSADFTRLGEEIDAVRAGGAGLLHLDVMDGHFVPNLTIGPPVVASVRRATDLPLDVHLMIEEPDRYIEAFIAAGADLVTVHQEAVPHLHRTVALIHEKGAAAGVAINPATPIGTLDDILPDLDVVLVMSVNPGFGGQKFIPTAIEKVRGLARRVAERGLKTRIEVDGGVGLDNLPALLEAGASLFVAGSAVYDGRDPKARAAALVALCHAGRRA
ncbi:MAG TPA: ribulose-phosphate 3-epimerase [Candidatus Polarisedimenticolia bacterium]|nr:ribulose-phosphate 3-epimerase [Candidatus Polarisedimenticolia bacterium]